MKRIIRISEDRLNTIIKESIRAVLDDCERVHADDVFDLDKIPMDVLDAAYQRYHPYEFTISHDSRLASTRRVCEGTDYKADLERVKKDITDIFPIPESNFRIFEGSHNICAAVLISLQDDNIDIIENHMEEQGYFRSQPTDDKLLVDRKNRKWLDARFEPTSPDDVTEEIKRKYDCVYHLAPKILEYQIENNGLEASNNNSTYRYSEARVYVTEGDIAYNDMQGLVDTLYRQASEKGYKNLTPEYVVFKIDLNKLDKEVRFYYYINTKNGLYTKLPISPECIVRKSYITAMSGDIIF